MKKSKHPIKWYFGVVFFLALFPFTITASLASTDGAGVCSESRFDRLPDGIAIWVLNHQAPVFEKAEDTSPNTTLNFSERLSIASSKTKSVYQKNNRLLIKDYSSNEEIGWVKRSDLLCGEDAQTADNGLDSRIFIKTEDHTYTSDKDRWQRVEVYQHATEKRCIAKECTKLSRFTGHFIYARKKTKGCKTVSEDLCYSYLLGGKVKLEATDNQLIGWVNSDNAFEWNNAYGLRASEIMDKDDYVCGYTTLEQAKNPSDESCPVLIPGGWQWYGNSNRMYLQERIPYEDNFIYKVISPLTQTNEVDATQEMRNILGNLKRLDIMFLIDGTNSMTPSMQAVKEAMGSIINTLPKGMQYRFAYQVFRDAYAKDKELGDYYPLSNTCDANEDTLKENSKEFISALGASVKVSNGDGGAGDKDHEENLFGGIKKAARDLRENCSDHMKILFVIGDTGYSGINQVEKYHREEIDSNHLGRLLEGGYRFPKDEKNYYETLGLGKKASAREIKAAYRRLARKYHPDVSKEPDAEERFKDISKAYEILGNTKKKQSYDNGERSKEQPPINKETEASNTSGKSRKPIITFFLQAKKRKKGDPAYEKAYKSFIDQAKDLVRIVLKGVGNRSKDIGININEFTDTKESDFIYHLEGDDLIKQINQVIHNYARPRFMSELESLVKGGMSYQEAANQLAGDPRYGNVPIVLVDQINVSECGSKKACQQQKTDRIVEFYIRKSSKIIEDIWMRKDRYNELVGLLKKLTDDIIAKKTKDARRKAIKAVLTENIESRLGTLSVEQKEQKLADLLKKLHTAVPLDSPLFNLKYNELDNLPDCVSEEISKWVVNYNKIMQVMLSSDTRLPLCSNGFTGSVDKAVAHFPPRCGRSDEELADLKQRVADSCKQGKDKLKNYVPLLMSDTAGYIVLPSSELSTRHCFGENENGECKNKDIMWIPANMLP